MRLTIILATCSLVLAEFNTATFPDLYIRSFSPRKPSLQNEVLIGPQNVPIDQSACINAAYLAEYGAWNIHITTDTTDGEPGVRMYSCQGIQAGDPQTYLTSHGIDTSAVCTDGSCMESASFSVIEADKRLVYYFTQGSPERDITTIEGCIAFVANRNSEAGESVWQAAQLLRLWSSNSWQYECSSLQIDQDTAQEYQYADTCGYLEAPMDRPTRKRSSVGKRAFPSGVTCEQMRSSLEGSPDLLNSCSTEQFVPLVPSSTRKLRRNRQVKGGEQY